MKRILLLVLLTMVVASAASFQNEDRPVTRRGQARAPRHTAPAPRIDESGLVTLSGNTRPEAIPANDLGRVAEDFRMEHMLLVLRRTPEQERALEQLIDELHNPKSPNFHHWLTAQEFGERFGLPERDLGKITGWLQSHGFEVNVVYPNRLLIDFTGTAAQVHEAFHTEIHHLEVNGEKHFANMSDPQIPAALAPLVVGVVSLHDFRPQPMIRKPVPYLYLGSCVGPGSKIIPCDFVTPADLATIYNLNPLFSAGLSGQGQTIAVAEDSNMFSTSDWTTFRSTFGLASAFPSGSLTTVHPPTPNGSGNPACTDPGVTADDNETTADVEWSSAAAPSAAILLASCTSFTTSGVFLATANLISENPPPPIISISFGASESSIGAGANAEINSLFQQAASEGISVFVASGDFGAAVTDGGSNVATHGINVNGFGSTPYNVSVGGTDFGDTYAGTNSTYWNTSNGTTYGSALSYIPEIPWNQSCASVLIATFVSGPGTLTYGSSGFCNSSAGASFENIAAGSGGPSACATGAPAINGVVGGTCMGYAKPTWQSVFGNPADGVRDLPDVSLFAASGAWGHAYVLCFSDIMNGGRSCSGTPDTWAEGGGTSISAPIMAGIQALVNQATGSKVGNPNPAYYALAALEYGSSGNANCNSTLGNGVASSCIFYDVTQGDMDVPCQTSITTSDCYIPSGTYGVLSTSTSSYAPAYAAGPGWDFATGIGTLNAYNFVTTLSAPLVSLSPFSVAFPVQAIGTTSGTTVVTLANSSMGALNSISFSISGANSGDFSLSQSCGSTLAYGASCPLSLTFKPTAPGPRKTLLSISDSAAGSPQKVILTGVGAAASLSPTSLSFGNQTVGTSSAAQMITLTNVGSATIHLWQIAITGTNAGDFSKTTTCGATLAASTSCTVSVTFKPAATGPRSASVLFSNDGGGSPQAVTMTGTGT